MSTLSQLVEDVRNEFLHRNRDLLALTKNGVNDVMRRVAAAMALNSQAQEDVLLYADAVDQRGYAGEVTRADFKREMYQATCLAFLKCQHNFVIEFVAKLTPEALAQLEAIEVDAGVREAPVPVAPPPPPKSAAELLEDEVRRDWKYLSTDKTKHKLNNRAYRETFDRLMASGQLDSQITSLHDGGAEFRI